MPNGEFTANLLPICPGDARLRLGTLIGALAGSPSGTAFAAAAASFSIRLDRRKLLRRQFG
jgi:hypothetical protein